jgi:hypothetical protein
LTRHARIEKTLGGALMKRGWIVLGLVLMLWAGLSAHEVAQAGALQARLDRFPNWRSQPTLSAAQGDLYYPDWLAGEWNVMSTLVDAVAPLAPELSTPGFESNRQQLGKAVTFPVRFKQHTTERTIPQSPFPVGQVLPQGIVADRVYNGTSLTEALMGKDVLQSIQVDTRSPNRQVARFRNGQELITQISDRATEINADREFISSELYQQEFRNATRIYLNQVENTIGYRLISTNPPRIEANQITAIYLSPQDPDYFKARRQPVALYRYRMSFEPKVRV